MNYVFWFLTYCYLKLSFISIIFGQKITKNGHSKRAKSKSRNRFCNLQLAALYHCQSSPCFVHLPTENTVEDNWGFIVCLLVELTTYLLTYLQLWNVVIKIMKTKMQFQTSMFLLPCKVRITKLRFYMFIIVELLT